MSLNFDPEDMENGLNDALERGLAVVRMFADTQARTLESDAKEQAKWTDRTGHARARLTGYTEENGDIIRIVLSHGVDYGIWLELANEKRYAIVKPMIELRAPFIMQDFENLLDNIT